MSIKKTDVDPAEAADEKPENLTPASDVAASGAFIEPEIVAGVDVDHPAVDNNPRAGTPASSNQIDFNDPTLTQAQAVAKNLGVDVNEDGDVPEAAKK